ncbi:hypothetical protein RV14_GL002339 [Enterococcus ratti]|uniref:Uncharacterized protein n=1 Tax=Enterococcus ratti TaxID=150033 RepID=A0A1L8WL99_9ENTE|nr:hypothetical protein RV14_GL002339 [Enterococcus ratti]
MVNVFEKTAFVPASWLCVLFIESRRYKYFLLFFYEKNSFIFDL